MATLKIVCKAKEIESWEVILNQFFNCERIKQNDDF